MSLYALSPACQPLASAICDGFFQPEGEDAEVLCSCSCHLADLADITTIPAMRDWHDKHHGVEIARLVREGLRPIAGDLVDA